MHAYPREQSENERQNERDTSWRLSKRNIHLITCISEIIISLPHKASAKEKTMTTNLLIMVKPYLTSAKHATYKY